MEAASGVLAVLVAVLDVIAIAQVWRSGIERGRKLIWSLVIGLLPVVGLIMWFVAARTRGRAQL
ncbi:PLD nuclease N-terminal domain-containing protein [Pseudomonas sp. PS1]|uniref:PLD nuclease N-terminal domain-containing protein n=1 Tax=Stutzerimonas marianensis TaxID=2929513 RepID=A0A9X1W4P1_9GAMM|nr:PLD nuclease N-terminal domain-containing protein [Pseudomonas marianensis]MCJ0973292.1 PLD nuclease N-terminal domain-containing protein [Pseudomonas marianensis]